MLTKEQIEQKVVELGLDCQSFNKAYYDSILPYADTIDQIATITVNGLEQGKYKDALDKINQLLTTNELRK